MEAGVLRSLLPLEGFCRHLDKLADQHGLHIVLSVSKGEEVLPAFMGPYILK